MPMPAVATLLYRDLVESAGFRYTCLVIGVMSMSTVFLTVGIIVQDEMEKAPNKKKSKRPLRIAPVTSRRSAG